ncbi:inner membrane protein [Stella humosa]|uniref:Inner membrane protein n=1 Tax=Stella humosa TaxID=94 RepID=A0A3N1LJ39_9PROT|nr:cell envelope integrity protein CreD [Stella humosa]ROP91320.1 inner membrane protein [Stella humosa]BBK34324.1 cell envelope integrity protein CreD [Stella humosa]
MTAAGPVSPIPARLRGGPAVKVVLVGMLVFALLIPLFLVHDAIQERHGRHREAVAEIGFAWGRPQALVGPVLVVPYAEDRKDTDGRVVTLRHRLFLFPERLEVAGELAPEVRYRGLFEAVVYRADVKVRASFTQPDLQALAGPRARIEPREAYLAVGLSDPRSIDPGFALTVDGRAVATAPDSGLRSGSLSWLRGALPVEADGTGRSFAVAFDMRFNGSERLLFAPLGKDTRATLGGAWPSPSFTGAFLPTDRRVTDDRFDASWAVSWFGRGFGESWAGGEAGDPGQTLEASLFGATLLQTVSPYRLVERAAKYGILFLVLTFAVYLLFELKGGLRIGIVSYGLVGLSLCLFYILLLALSEPFGFAPAYGAAALAVVVQASLYTSAVSRSLGRGALFGGLLAGLYGVLFVLLGLESYALLLGAVLLFAALSAVMYLTRRIDWQARGPVERAAPTV